ncbi:hypothetical protein [Pararhizobium sp. IMCC21322]|uniref:hypothetical protein n=1 Tax=Pararhizobium sp. IMCC21322 TaxID=3067903 RepID=UPI0027423AC5|nr:hypothetical protein [Pararhizobium sp. IMCC21322]
MHIIGKVFFGVIATILLFLIMTAGNPPAVSFFWKTETLTVVGHETEDWNSGWGIIRRTLPRVDRSSPEAKYPTAMLHIDEHITDRDAVVENWPIGLQVKSRLHPSERIAYPSSKWPFMTVPAFGFATVLLFLAGFQIHRLFEQKPPANSSQRQSSGYGSAGWILALFILLFTAVPLFLTIFAANFGDPPPRSVLWPRETVEIVSSEARIFNVGNGTKAAYLDVFVKAPNDLNAATEQIKGTSYSSVSIRHAREVLASDYQTGELKSAMRSPRGELFVVRFRYTDGFAILAILLSLLCFFVVRMLWRVFS